MGDQQRIVPRERRGDPGAAREVRRQREQQERGHDDRQNRGQPFCARPDCVCHTQKAYGIRMPPQSLMLATNERSTAPRAGDFVARAERARRSARAEPRAHRHRGHRARRQRRPWRTVDGPAGRAPRLRHDVAVPARRQQGRVGDLHALDGARAAARAHRSRGLAWSPDGLGRGPVGHLPPAPLGPGGRRGRPARRPRPAGLAQCGIGRTHVGRDCPNATSSPR